MVRRGARTISLLTAAALALAAGGQAAAAGGSGTPCPVWATPATQPPTLKPATATSSVRAPAAALAAVSYLPNGIAVGPTRASIGAALVPAVASAAALIRYGPTAGSTLCGPVQWLGPGSTPGMVRFPLRALQPDTVYRFQLVARTAAGVVFGPQRTFRTLAAGHVPQGVEVGALRLGGVGLDAARTLLARAVASPLRISYAGALWQVSRTQAGARLDVQDALTAALTAPPRALLPALKVKVDAVRLHAYVASLVRRWGRTAAKPVVRLAGTHAVVTAGARGVRVEAAKMAALIARELTTGATAVLPLAVDKLAASAAPARQPDKAVVIRLGPQTLTAYLDGKPVLETPVTSGRPALPTPIGSYYVHFRASPYTFVSPWPQGSPYWYPPTPVTWAMFFFDNDFLHDDPGEPSSAYGRGSEYGPYASHGCVHVPHDAMAFLYRWLPVGAPVIVSQT